MSAESSAGQASSPAPSLLGPPLMWATRLALRFPVATIALALGLAAASLALTATRLSYKTSRLDLLDPSSDYNRLWIEYIEEFGDEDDAVVVVQGAHRDQVVPVLQEIAELLNRDHRLFHAVLHGVDLEKIHSKGLHYLSPEELAGLEKFLDRACPIVEGDWARLNVGRMASGLETMLGDAPEAEQEAERLGASLHAALGRNPKYQSPWPGMPQSFSTLSELNNEYLLAKEGRLGFVLLRLAPGDDGFVKSTEATEALRELIAEVNLRHPETKAGLTGLPIMENDEMRSSQSSMYWASLLSFGGVAILFVAGFGGVRHALFANLVLLVGIAWSFGFVTLAIGHLNILSMSFTVTLIGIGIDYGVYFVARYLQVKARVRDCQRALLETSQGVGPAILTGAITTSISFFAAGFTTFKGVAELGIIAGGGILLCAAAELLVLPAVLAVVDRSGWGNRAPDPLPVHGWINPLLKRPRLLLGSTLAFTLVAAVGIDHLRYDHNLLNLQADDLESVELERRLLAESDQSVWYALSMADSEQELLERKARLLKMESVERTEEIVSLLPSDQTIKGPIIARIRERLAELPEVPPQIPLDKPGELGRRLADLQSRWEDEDRGGRTAQRLEEVRDRLRRLPIEESYEQISRFQQQMAGDLLSRLHMLKRMANPEPPRLADLPPSLVNRFVGHHGKHLLKIYGRGDIWDMSALSHFVKDVRAVDPRATGNPLQAYEASLEMKHSYEQAAIYALLVIVVVLMFDLRSPRDAILAAAPLGLGVLQMLGLMGALDIPLNPANMIALPLILGIGVDYGVHIVHEFREKSGPYRMSHATALAVLVDALTTLVGFGSLMVASHQGLRSLGRVLTLGVTCCLFTSMVMLPAFLRLLTRNRPETEPETDADIDAFGHGSIDHDRRRTRRMDAAHDVSEAPAAAPVVRPRRFAQGARQGSTWTDSESP